jgi:two-component system chemotaxis sensor kinase CheA
VASMVSEPPMAHPEPASTATSERRTATPPRVLSVGVKLASATVALMVIVTAIVYSELSAYQREHLLQAKQRAALAVTRLFARSCAAPIVFGDNTAIDEALRRLGKSDDIPYAAVWSSDESGRPEQRLGELGDGQGISVGTIPSILDLRREPTRLLLVAPVRDVDDKLVGGAVVAFSLVREKAVIAEVQSNTLLASGVIAVGLTLLLLSIARVAIVRPLGKLVIAANAIELGKASDIEVRSRDEIGQLAGAFRSMARAIASREERIVARNRDMRLVLDNVGQGFLTLDLEARISEERSRVVEEWFGVPESGAEFGPYIARVDPKAAERFEVGWLLVSDPLMPPELSLEHLPPLIRTEGRVFELAYRPISKGEQLEQVLVVITDVSARVERERAAVAEREMMSVFKRILAGRAVFEEFFDEASLLVLAIRASDGSDRLALQRNVHTLKGNASAYGLETIAELCHSIENELDATGGVVSDERKRQLQSGWGRVARMRSEFSGDSGISVQRDEHRALLEALRARGLTDLATRLASWQFEPASRRLDLIGRQIKSLARRVGKGDVEVHIVPTDLRLPGKVWAPFWTALTHIVRNTVDHGIETRERRVELGKSGPGTVTLSMVHADHELIWAIEDDGRGIDWAALATRAQSLGLPVNTRKELEAALFAPGVSSKDRVTTISGRGVGLDAVLEMVNALGGRIEVESELDKGTKFTIHLPESMLCEKPGSSDPGAANGQGEPLSVRGWI